MIKGLRYVKINSVNPLYLILSKMKINKSKYLTLVTISDSKKKKYEGLWIKIRDLIRSISKNSDDYDEKFMKTKFNSDDELPLNKTIKIPSMIIVAGAIFHKNNNSYSQVFILDVRKTKI